MSNEPDPKWVQVDRYYAGHFLAPDDGLEATLAANARAGLPAIDVIRNRFTDCT